MSSQGEPSSGKSDGAWWDAVYEGPDDEVPDTPDADSRQGSVDDWFDSASGVISGNPAPLASGRAARPEPGGPPTLVDEPVRRPAVPGQSPPQPGPPAPPANRVPAPPPLPPLPIRPPRIPSQVADPRTAAGLGAPGLGAPGPGALGKRRDAADRYSADRYDADGYDADVYEETDEVYEEPRVVRDARAGLPDRQVRDLDGVRDANDAQAAAEAEAEAAADARTVPAADPAPSLTEPPAPAPDPYPADLSPADPYPADRGSVEPDPDDLYRGAPDPVGREAEPDPGVEAEPEALEPLPQVGEQPPAYEPEPTALPVADPDLLTGIVPDTALDGARYGTMTLRAVSVRGDAARHHGAGRADRLLTVRFGEGSDALLLVVLATPPSPENPAPADEACRQLAAAIGRSRAELLSDLRVGAQERLRYGLQRLTARAAVRLQNVPYPSRGEGAGAGGALHALIAPLDPTSRLRAGFGIGPGGLLLLGDDAWYDAYAGRRLVAQQPSGSGPTTSGARQSPDRFRFRVVAPEPGDVLLLCSDGLAQPLREEPAVSDFLADHWAHPHPPGTVDFLRQVQVRAKGYAADRTAAAIWED